MQAPKIEILGSFGSPSSGFSVVRNSRVSDALAVAGTVTIAASTGEIRVKAPISRSATSPFPSTLQVRSAADLRVQNNGFVFNNNNAPTPFSVDLRHGSGRKVQCNPWFHRSVDGDGTGHGDWLSFSW